MDYVDVYELREKMLSDYLKRIQNGASPEKAMIATVADAFTGNLTADTYECAYRCTRCGILQLRSALNERGYCKTCEVKDGNVKEGESKC